MQFVSIVIIGIISVLILHGQHVAALDEDACMKTTEDVAQDLRKVRGQLDQLSALLKLTLEDFNQTAGAKLDQLHKSIDRFGQRMIDVTRLFRDGIITLAICGLLSICIISWNRYYSGSTVHGDNQIQSSDIDKTDESLSPVNDTCTHKISKLISDCEFEALTNSRYFDNQMNHRNESLDNGRINVAVPVLTTAFLLSLTNLLMKNPHLSSYFDIPWHVIIYFALGFLLSYTCYSRVQQHQEWYCRYHSIIICLIFLLCFVFFFAHVICDAQYLTFSICTVISSGGAIFFVTIYSIIIYYQDKISID